MFGASRYFRRLTHRRRGLLVAIVGATFLAVLGIAWQRGFFAKPLGPRLQLLTLQDMDLGEGKPGEVLESVVWIRNNGTENLVFGVDRSCNCALLAPREGEIEPGEVQEIRVGVQLKRKGKDEHVQLLIHSNDPVNPDVACRLNARCPAPFTMSPETIDFGDVQVGTNVEGELRLFASNGDPLAPANQVSVSTSSPHLAVERDMSRSDQLVFRVHLQSSCPRGYYQGEILVSPGNPSEEESVPVCACIRGVINVAPSVIRLPSCRDSQDDNVKLLVWRSDQRPLGKPSRVILPAGLRIAQQANAPNRCLFRVERESSLVRDSALDGQEIRISFEGTNDEASVRIAAGHEN